MAGGAYGLVVNALLPGVVAPPGAYALVGMGALFAGAAHAPITSILILFEMTDDYQIILPLMIAVVISYLLSSALNSDSIYTIKLRRRGGMTRTRAFKSALDSIVVADAMTADYPTVGPDEPVHKLAAELHSGHLRSFPVVDGDRGLVGIVTVYDVERALMGEDAAGKCARDIMTRNLITCTPDQPLRDVLHRITRQDVGQIPVVSKDDHSVLLGVLRRAEIFWAYGEVASEHRRLVERTDLDLADDNGDPVQIDVEVRSEHEQLCFKKIRDIPVPEQCLIAILRRAERAVIPRGDTVVEPGDVLVLLTVPAHEKAVEDWIAEVTA
jgi:CIC family chloride channel protein